MDKKLYLAPELEVIELEAQMAILAGSDFDDPDGEGGSAPMDPTPSTDPSDF